MSKVIAIAWRDFKHTALTKTFILAAVFFPVLIAGFMFIANFFTNTAAPAMVGTLVIIDETGSLADTANEELENIVREAREKESPHAIRDEVAALKRGDATSSSPLTNRRFRRVPSVVRVTIEKASDHSPAAVDRYKDQVRSGEIMALAVVPKVLFEPRAENILFELFVEPGINPDHRNLLESAVSGGVVRARVSRANADLDAARLLVSTPRANVVRIRADGVETSDNPFVKMLIPAAFMFLLWISTFTSANYLLTSTIEEKSNKVMEVLLSAVSPMQLMTGKILAQGLVGLIMMVTYSSVVIAGMVVMSMADLVPAITLMYVAIYFIMAYFMIASIMAGVGSAVSDLREAQALVTPATLILIVPFILWFPISQNPNGLLAVIASFIPPMTPFAMILRITGSEPVPLWQIIATIIFGYAMMVAMIGICAKIFRVGVLMYGKPPTPLELLKWVRYS